jgi:hypothetical protein
MARQAGRASLRIGLLDPLSESDLDDVTKEGDRLLAFVEPDAETREVQFQPLSTA